MTVTTRCHVMTSIMIFVNTSKELKKKKDWNKYIASKGLKNIIFRD